MTTRIIHVEKKCTDPQADVIFFYCGQFCTLGGDCGIHQPGIDFVVLPGPWPDPPTCEGCIAKTRAPARSLEVVA